MKADIIPLIAGILIFVSSLISLRIGLSVAIIELTLGAIAGNLGFKAEEWMMYLANFGGILLTFLAGTEIDTRIMREKFKESFLIGFVSFIFPFIGVAAYTYLISGWSLHASLIAGTALSCTSLAVVYSVLVETGLSGTMVGKILMSSTFVTDIGTALALSVLFVRPTIYSLVFVIVSVLVVILAAKFSHIVFDDPRLKDKVIEPEIKYIFFLLLVFIYFAGLGGGQAILPAFVLGLTMSKHFTETSAAKAVRNRLRTVAYAVITPLFFVVGGIKMSFPMIMTSFGLFSALLSLKLLTKSIGVYFLAKRYIQDGSLYVTLLMSAGLTFGAIAALFGYRSGIIDQTQYSVLIGVILASAILPTFVAQKWFMPKHSEDIIEIEDK